MTRRYALLAVDLTVKLTVWSVKMNPVAGIKDATMVCVLDPAWMAGDGDVSDGATGG